MNQTGAESTRGDAGARTVSAVLFLKSLLFTLIVPGTVAVYLPLILVRKLSLPSGPLLFLGFGVLAAGGGIYCWCVWDFAAFGRGTPVPIDAPKRLVMRGLYRYTRNPMYLGVLTMIIGWAILFPTGPFLIYALTAAIGFQLMVVLYEERHLEREFGDEYDAYRSQVGRWLPVIRRRRAPS